MSEQPLTQTLQIHDDPLLQCLLLIGQLYHKRFTPDTLLAGLPVVEGRLTSSLLLRAASRAGFSAKLGQLKLTEIQPHHLPVILLLKDGSGYVLERCQQETYGLLDPRSGGHLTLSQADLTAVYSGVMVLIKPAYEFGQRTEVAAKTKPRHWFWHVFLQELPTYSEILLASFLINLFALASPLFVMNVYDRVVPNQATATLWVLASGVLLVYGFDLLLRLLRGYFIDHASQKIDTQLSSTIFEQVMGLTMTSRPKSTGTLANMVHSFEAFREFFTSATISALVDLPFFLIFLTVLWSIGGYLALIPLLAMPLVVCIGLLIQIPLNDLIQKNYRFAAEKQATLIESIGGIETIKSMGAEGTMQHRWEQATHLAAHNNARLRFYSSLGVNIATFIQHVASVVMVISGVYLITAGELSMGGLIACTILSGRAMAPMAPLAGLIARYRQSVTALTSLNEIMAMDIEAPKTKTPLQHPQITGAVTFKEVQFGYQHERPILKNLSFEIAAGEKVGIIGRIGSGKSTLLKLINGLYRPHSGTVLIDGIDNQQLDMIALRRQIAYVPQDIVLFYGTLKQNITLGAPYIDDALVLQAAAISGIGQLANSHPEGFDMMIEEQGKNLSGGQRQMIAVARAFLHDPPLVLLDEPTSALDDKTNALLKEQLLTTLAHKTLMLVTHRSAMLTLVDRLMVVERGQIIADGPKATVLAALKAGQVSNPENSQT